MGISIWEYIEENLKSIPYEFRIVIVVFAFIVVFLLTSYCYFFALSHKKHKKRQKSFHRSKPAGVTVETRTQTKTQEYQITDTSTKDETEQTKEQEKFRTSFVNKNLIEPKALKVNTIRPDSTASKTVTEIDSQAIRQMLKQKLKIPAKLRTKSEEDNLMKNITQYQLKLKSNIKKVKSNISKKSKKVKITFQKPNLAYKMASDVSGVPTNETTNLSTFPKFKVHKRTIIKTSISPSGFSALTEGRPGIKLTSDYSQYNAKPQKIISKPLQQFSVSPGFSTALSQDPKDTVRSTVKLNIKDIKNPDGACGFSTF